MSEAHEQEHEQEHHIVSPVTYMIIFGALLVGTALTVLASYFDLGEWHIAPGLTLFWNPVVALAIATTKMMLVVLFFMHVKFSSQLTKLFAILGFLWFTLMFIIFGDYMTRPREQVSGWEDTSSQVR